MNDKSELACYVDQLSSRIINVCASKGWSLDWNHRGVYLHLEASEFIESIRGKTGNPPEEAADVLFTLLAMTTANNILWDDIVRCLERKIENLCKEGNVNRDSEIRGKIASMNIVADRVK